MTSRLLAFTLTALLVAPLALAGPARHLGKAGARGADSARPGSFLPPPGYLGLDEGQQESARGILEALAADVQPLREERRHLGQSIQTELGSDAPSATAIGEAMIAIEALGEELRSAAQNAEADFVQLLDSDQLTKWENFQELRALTRAGRGRPGPDGESP